MYLLKWLKFKNELILKPKAFPLKSIDRKERRKSVYPKHQGFSRRFGGNHRSLSRQKAGMS
jgi:hypothetical protein